MKNKYESFKKIIRECNYDNTYKTAWGKSIVELSSKFTAYYIAVALTLKSVYSQRFYELCCQYKSKKSFVLGTDEIRKFLAIEDKLSGFKNIHGIAFAVPLESLIGNVNYLMLAGL